MKRIGLMLIAITMGGCATLDGARDTYAGLRTQFANGFQQIGVEIAPEAVKLATFEGVKVEANAYTSQSFEVSGIVSYPKACKFLSVEAKFLSKDGSAAGTAKGIVQGYAANEKARFKAPLLNIPTNSGGLLNKVRIESVTCL